MLMQKIERYLSAILAAAIGILFIVLKEKVIDIAMTVIGVAMIVMGVLDAIDHRVPPAIVKCVFGVVLIAFGLLLMEVVLYLLAAALVIYGSIELYNNIRYKVRGYVLWDTVIMYATPVMWLIIGMLLFFNMNATVEGVFIAAGIFMLIQAVLLFVEELRRKR